MGKERKLREESQDKKTTCFVIQLFDGSTFDRRYNETFKPALERAGVIPQRADEILGTNPVIEKIEAAIKAAPICVAEVSADNPNVWLELGYALALERPVIILCEKERRPRLPFDVQHRPVIFYRTDSRSGFDELEKKIVNAIRFELDNMERIDRAPVLKAGSAGAITLKDHEVAILTTIFSFSTIGLGRTSSWELEKKMKAMGYQDFTVALGVSSLVVEGYLSEEVVEESDSFGEAHYSKYFHVTDDGSAWLREHQDALEIRTPAPKATEETTYPADDDIPF